jgi:hypothetical protein
MDEFTMRVPAEPDRDADIVLCAASDEIIRLRARIAELESQPADQFTAELVEIDGHVYGLRPGAARVVREALRDAGRYRWLRSRNELADVVDPPGPYVCEGDEGWTNYPSGDAVDAAIDAALAKDGA